MLGIRQVVLLVYVLIPTVSFAQQRDPDAVLQEAEQLSWLKAWPRAAPLYEEAARLFRVRGDHRNALYADVNALRGRLHRLPVPEVSQQFAEYLDHPLVQKDPRLRLRILVLKGEADEDIDPTLAESSWREALALAKQLDDRLWANRALGELGVVAFLQGNVSMSIIQLGTAIKTAELLNDRPSQVRWLTLFGHGYLEMGRPDQAMPFYARALTAAAAVPGELMPVMTYLGQGDALLKSGKPDEAEAAIRHGLTIAEREGALGYQAELTWRLGLIARARNQPEEAMTRLMRANDFAAQAGGNRIVAGIALDLARLQRAGNQPRAAEQTIRHGIRVARAMHERMVLPRLLAELADTRWVARQYSAARELLDEASDLLEGLLTHVSSPWVRSQLLTVMNEVIETRIRLEGRASRDPQRLYTVIEQTRGRSLLELLIATPVASIEKPAALHAGERDLARLQTRLFTTSTRADREKLLSQIAVLEEHLGPASTAMFDQTRPAALRAGRAAVLKDLQLVLPAGTLFLEYALAEPSSYVVIVTSTTARVQSLAGRATVQGALDDLLRRTRDGDDAYPHARTTATLLLDPITEVPRARRLIISADADLHRLPFELLTNPAGTRLLQSHVVSYAPSGAVLAHLMARVHAPPDRRALAISGGGPDPDVPSPPPSTPGVARGLYDVDPTTLPPLPAANDEARAVATIFGTAQTTVLLGAAATEAEVKRLPLETYRVIHFAAHGIPSTQFPARSAIVLKPGEAEDGLLQAREILMLRLRADVVTLAACDTGAGRVSGQEGVANLVRPFLAAGARAVVANLWAADDTFSLTLTREFYRRLASGTDAAEALRQAKLQMVDRFGAAATPNLWSGLLVYGDGSVTVNVSPIPTGAPDKGAQSHDPY